MAAKSSSGGFGKFLLGFLFAVVLIAAGLWAYLRFGTLPVAVADKAFPIEAQIVHVPMDARIDREKKAAPFGTSEDVFEGGARTYLVQCASCHGTPGHNVAFADQMSPVAPPLWATHKHANGDSHVGVSDDEPGRRPTGRG